MIESIWRHLRDVLVGALVVLAAQACGPSAVPLDTLPGNPSEAENLAYSVAENADCGTLEALDPAGQQEPWHFACQTSNASYDIVVFGSDTSRQSGLHSLQDKGSPYVAKDYYAVTIVPSGPSKQAVLEASPDPSLLDPFK